MTKKATVKIKTGEEIGQISPFLYGHFAEQIGGVIYGGVFVGKDSEIPNANGFRLDLIEKLKRIAPSVIRWPGGCFAECYDWQDGVGEDRPTRPSWWTREDGRYEDNAFGTHEFIELCRLVGAEPYLAVRSRISPLLLQPSMVEWKPFWPVTPPTVTLPLSSQ